MGLNMLTNNTIEAVILEIARKEGIELNGQDKLVLRTKIAQKVAAKKRYQDRINADVFEWKRPEIPYR